MRLIIEARLADEGSDTGQDVERVRLLAVTERPDCSLADVGLTLAEGRALLAEVQAQLVSPQHLHALLHGSRYRFPARRTR